MLVFPDPARAIECAAAIQRGSPTASPVEGERVRVRMGMHAGEAIREDGDFFGRSVILAARIAAQARGGEILVSEALKQRAGDGDGATVGFDAGPRARAQGPLGHPPRLPRRLGAAGRCLSAELSPRARRPDCGP